MAELVILPPHLIEKIRAILAADLELPETLRSELQAGLDQPLPPPPLDDVVDSSVTVSASPQTIDILVLERLSRWVSSDENKSSLKKHQIGKFKLPRSSTQSVRYGTVIDHLDPNEYGMITLLAGTELYIPPHSIPMLSSAASSTSIINPYLPSYLSPLPPSFGQEYRSLARQLSTVLNILFSIFGSAFAVYVAATTGGGYTREKGILMGVVAGVIVGIADGVLVWIFQNRVKESREEGRRIAIELSKGSGADKEQVQDEGVAGFEGDGEGISHGEKEPETARIEVTPVIKKDIRLRRRAIPEKKPQ